MPTNDSSLPIVTSMQPVCLTKPVMGETCGGAIAICNVWVHGGGEW